ncbi:MAG: hypothetical protein ACFCU2_01510 [Acidimicrobiia bacterium]
MTYLVAGSLGLNFFGFPGCVAAVLAVGLRRYLPRRRREDDLRPIMMVLLVELRGGRSVLSALQSAAARFPEAGELKEAVRVASVAGLTAAADGTRGGLRFLLIHLARAQATGASAADAVRRFLDDDLARERAERQARVKALPVRLMLPLSLLTLPGVVLLAYGPTILSLLDGLVVPFD